MTETFTQTSNEPYLRHHYKLVYKNGKSIVVDNYADVHQLWVKTTPEYIEVLDIQKKKQSSGGF